MANFKDTKKGQHFCCPFVPGAGSDGYRNEPACPDKYQELPLPNAFGRCLRPARLPSR